MSKTYLEMLSSLDGSRYVDIPTCAKEEIQVQSRPARDSVEDRSNADVMRENGATEAEIRERFGYSPRPFGEQQERRARFG